MKQAYDYSRVQQQAKAQELENERKSKALFRGLFLLSILVIALLVLLYCVRKKYATEKARNALLKVQHAAEISAASEKIAKKEAEIAMIENRMKKVMQEKAEKADAISMMENQYKSAVAELSRLRSNHLRLQQKYIQTDDIVLKFQDMAQCKKGKDGRVMQPTVEDWTVMTQTMEQKFPLFMQALTTLLHDTQSTNARLCMLHKLGFKNKDISVLLIKGESTISSYRIRIYKETHPQVLLSSAALFNEWIDGLGEKCPPSVSILT